MKHDKMKRVLAATLSLLTVAGPMTANVGGIIKEVALVAHAAEAEDQTMTLTSTGSPLYKFIKAYKNGTRDLGENAIASTSASSFVFTPYLDTTIQSTVPLTFAATQSATPTAEESLHDAYLTTGALPAIANLAYDTTGKYYDSTKVFISKDKAKASFTENGKVYYGYCETTNSGTVDESLAGKYLKDDKTEATTLADIKYKASATAETGGGYNIYAVKLMATDAQMTTLKNGNYAFKIAEDAVVDAAAEEFAGVNAKNDYLQALTATDGYSIAAADGKITFKLADYEESYKNGVYTYSFIAPQFGLTVQSISTALTVTNGLEAPNSAGTADKWWGPTTNQKKNDKGVIAGLTAGVTITNVKGDTLCTDTTVDGTKVAYVNEDLKVTALDKGNNGYFKLYVWNGNVQTNYKVYEPNLNDTGYYEVTIKACDVAGFAADTTGNQGAAGQYTNLFIEKAAPAYAFEISSDKTTLTAKGNGINKEAATITAESFAKDKDGNYPSKGTELKTDAEAVANGGRVVVDFMALDEYTLEGTKDAAIVITRNGKEIADSTVIAKDASNNDLTYATLKDEIFKNAAVNGKFSSKITLEGAGEYEIEYSVWVHETTETSEANLKKKLYFNFEIAKLSELTAKNVQLTCTNYTGNLDTILKSATPKLIDGVYVFEMKQGTELKNKTVKIDADLFTDIAKKSAFGNKNETDKDRYYTVTGATEVNKTDTVQVIKVNYYDPEFSKEVKTIELKWKVAEAEPVVQIVRAKAEAEHLAQTGGQNFSFEDVDWDLENVESGEWKPDAIHTSIDEIADLEQIIKDDYVVVNGDAKNVTYKYVVGAGVKLANAEMDTEYEGLPNKVGKYSVYLMYKGEEKQIVDVFISEHSLYAAPTEAQLSFTYGTELFNEETLVYKDISGKVVEGVTVTDPKMTIHTLEALTNKEKKTVRDGRLDYGNGSEVYEVDGELYKDGGVAQQWDGKSVNVCTADHTTTKILHNVDPTQEYLNAGNYIVIVEQDENSTKIDQEGYSLSKKEFIVKVAKKQITKDMILIDPLTYNKKSQTITKNKVHGTDIELDKDFKDDNSVALKIARGTDTGTDIGGYTVVITVDDTNEETNTNYKGEVQMDWFIVPDAKAQNQTDFDWRDSQTTIVDNGNIRAFVTRPANTSYSKNITEYGLIYEKNGKLAAPEFGLTAGEYNVGGKKYSNHTEAYVAAKDNKGYYYVGADDKVSTVTDDKVKAAYTALQYGNGIVEKKCLEGSAAMGRQDLSAKIAVNAVDTGVWVRPYVLLENGDIYYGEVRYINLVDEATDILGLKTAVAGSISTDTDVAQTAKSAADVKATASKKELTNKTWRDRVRAGFDESTGKYFVFSSYTIKQGSEVKQSAIERFGFVVDKTGKVNGKNVEKTLKVDSGFVQGLAQPNNKNYDDDEVGAKIAPANGVNDVWYRTFVDFGNGLIVYTDAVKLLNVSDQFASKKPAATPTKNANTGKIKMQIPDTKLYADDAFKAEEATLKYVGMVADNKGSFTAINSAKTDYLYASQETYDAMQKDLTAENAAANGYSVKRVARTDSTIDFDAYITPEYDAAGRQIPVAFRPFAVYVINGHEITIYGEAQAYNGTKTLDHTKATDFADGKYVTP